MKYTNVHAQERLYASLPWNISVSHCEHNNPILSLNRQKMNSKCWKISAFQINVYEYTTEGCSEVKETGKKVQKGKKKEMELVGSFALYTAPRTCLTTCLMLLSWLVNYFLINECIESKNRWLCRLYICKRKYTHTHVRHTHACGHTHKPHQINFKKKNTMINCIIQ